MNLIEKLALWVLRKVGNVRHVGEGNSLVLKDQFGKEVRMSAPRPGDEAWEAGCTCTPDRVVSSDCPLHYLPQHKAVYVRLK